MHGAAWQCLGRKSWALSDVPSEQMAGGRKATQHLLGSAVQREECYINQNSGTRDYKKEEMEGRKEIRKEGRTKGDEMRETEKAQNA